MLLAALIVASLLNKRGRGGGEKKFTNSFPKPFTFRDIQTVQHKRNSVCFAQPPFKCKQRDDNNNRLLLVTCVTRERQKDYCSERCG